jgi:hypothetical protein
MKSTRTASASAGNTKNPVESLPLATPPLVIESPTSSKLLSFQARLALSTALAFGYGNRGAYAGSCTGGVGVYSCTGAAGSDTTQSLNNASSLTVTTSSGFGIATATGNALDLNLTAAATGGLSFTDNHASAITGSVSGIYDRNEGTGGVAVTSTGTVTGGQYGISADNYSSSTTSVTASGIVTGGTGAAIQTFGNKTSITLNSGAAVSSASGIAITNDGSNSTVLVNSGASVTGAINLGGGTDSLTFDGSDFSGVTSFNGGGGTDNLRFSNINSTVDGASVTNMEIVTIGSGGII